MPAFGRTRSHASADCLSSRLGALALRVLSGERLRLQQFGLLDTVDAGRLALTAARLARQSPFARSHDVVGKV